MTVAVLLLLLAVGDAAGGAWLLRYGLRRERRDVPAVIVVGVLLLVGAVTLGGIAVHVSTHPAQTRIPLERVAWPVGLAVPKLRGSSCRWCVTLRWSG